MGTTCMMVVGNTSDGRASIDTISDICRAGERGLQLQNVFIHDEHIVTSAHEQFQL